MTKECEQCGGNIPIVRDIKDNIVLEDCPFCEPITCHNCGNPKTMYWCTKCEQNQEADGLCEECNDHVVIDEHYHDNCN